MRATSALEALLLLGMIALVSIGALRGLARHFAAVSAVQAEVIRTWEGGTGSSDEVAQTRSRPTGGTDSAEEDDFAETQRGMFASVVLATTLLVSTDAPLAPAPRAKQKPVAERLLDVMKDLGADPGANPLAKLMAKDLREKLVVSTAVEIHKLLQTDPNDNADLPAEERDKKAKAELAKLRVLSPQFDQLLEYLPGETPSAKLRSLRRIYRNIEPTKANLSPEEHLYAKLLVFKKLMSLAKSLPQRPAGPGKALANKGKDSKALIPNQILFEIQDKWYPFAKKVAGSDGYLDHADLEPLMSGVLSDATIDKLATELILRSTLDPAIKPLVLEAYRTNSVKIGPVTITFKENLREKAHAAIRKKAKDDLNGKGGKVFELFGVESGKNFKDEPVKRDIGLDDLLKLTGKEFRVPTVTTQQLKQGKFPQIEEALRFKELEAMMPTFERVARDVRFPKGIPVKQLEPLIMHKKLPLDVVLELDGDGRLIIR